MKIRDLRARMSFSKPFLKIGTKRSRLSKRPKVTLAMRASTHITANYQMRLEAIKYYTLNKILLMLSQIQPSFSKGVFEFATTAKDMDQKF